MDNQAEAAQFRRARLASHLTAAVLILGGGYAIAAGATGLPSSSSRPRAAIPTPPRATPPRATPPRAAAVLVEDAGRPGADNQASILALLKIQSDGTFRPVPAGNSRGFRVTGSH